MTNGARMIIETEDGITVYPPKSEGGRWRATWYEPGARNRSECGAKTEAELAAKLEKVSARLKADAPLMLQPGSALVAHSLDPSRHEVTKPWSLRHRHTQTRLCDKHILPVIADVICQDIKVSHSQAIVNSARTPKEGARLHRALRAMINTGIFGGYLANPRLHMVHWQPPAGTVIAPARATTAGEHDSYVDADEIPSHEDVSELGKAATEISGVWWHELMINFAAYSGVRWGETAALPIDELNCPKRQVRVAQQIVDLSGKLHVTSPKHSKIRQTIYPRVTPAGYPLAEALARRRLEAEAAYEAGRNPHRLLFTAPRGGYLRSSNFRNRVLKPAYEAAGWREPAADIQVEIEDGWVWHSLRHVFCTTALNDWGIDISVLAGHANSRFTMDVYVGRVRGILARAQTATS